MLMSSILGTWTRLSIRLLVLIPRRVVWLVFWLIWIPCGRGPPVLIRGMPCWGIWRGLIRFSRCCVGLMPGWTRTGLTRGWVSGLILRWLIRWRRRLWLLRLLRVVVGLFVTVLMGRLAILMVRVGGGCLVMGGMVIAGLLLMTRLVLRWRVVLGAVRVCLVMVVPAVMVFSVVMVALGGLGGFSVATVALAVMVGLGLTAPPERTVVTPVLPVPGVKLALTAVTVVMVGALGS